MHEVLEKLKKQTEKELEKITAKDDMTPTELENAKKAVCLMKEIQEVEMGEAIGEASGYSQASYRGNSYRRGRDADSGRYISRSYEGPYAESRGGSYRQSGGNSYEQGYSGHSINDRMIDNLERMMDEAGTEHERQSIMNAIHRISAER